MKGKAVSWHYCVRGRGEGGCQAEQVSLCPLPLEPVKVAARLWGRRYSRFHLHQTRAPLATTSDRVNGEQRTCCTPPPPPPPPPPACQAAQLAGHPGVRPQPCLITHTASHNSQFSFIDRKRFVSTLFWRDKISSLTISNQDELISCKSFYLTRSFIGVWSSYFCAFFVHPNFEHQTDIFWPKPHLELWESKSWWWRDCLNT